MKFDLRPPGGNITWLSLIWLVLGCLFVAAFVQGLPATWPWFCASTFVIAVSAGLWFRRPWARWAGFVVAAALLGLRISGLFRHGITLSQSLRLFFNLWYFWALWEWDLRKDESTDSDNDDAPMISLVQLLREPRYLDSQILAHLATRAWGVSVTVGGDKNTPIAESSAFVVGELPNLVAMCNGMFFSILSVSAPYLNDADAAKSTKNLRVRQPLLEHRAWLSVDVIGCGDDRESIAKAYCYIGKLHAELLDDNCLAFFHPATGRIYSIDSGVEEKLCADDPLAALEENALAPVIEVSDDDPRMQAAVTEARRRWPEFVAAWESRGDNDSFAVKGAISDGENTEYMWLIVTAIENDIAYGRIDNDPLNVRGVKPGDVRRVAGAGICDWLYFEDGTMQGGFSIEALRDIQSRNDSGS